MRDYIDSMIAPEDNSSTWTSLFHRLMECQSMRMSTSGQQIRLNNNFFMNSKIPLMSQERVLMRTTMQEDYYQIQGDASEWFHTEWKNLMDSQTRSTITVFFSWEFNKDFSQTMLPPAQSPIVRNVTRGITIFGKTIWIDNCVEGQSRSSKITDSFLQSVLTMKRQTKALQMLYCNCC